MIGFVAGALAGLGILCSMSGWGWATARLLRLERGKFIGFHGALGVALSTFVGGVFNLVHLISPTIIRSYLLVGLLLAILAVLVSLSDLVRGIKAALLYLRRNRLVAVLLAILLVVAALKYSAAVSPGKFQPQDDWQGYFTFPVKMLQTGFLGPDPFSERRIQTSLGGQEFLDTFVLGVTGNTRNLNLLDSGVAFLLVLSLLAEIMVQKRLPGLWIAAVLLSATLFVAPVSNITAVFSAVLLLILLFDLFSTAAAKRSPVNPVVLALLFASLACLKTTFVPVVAFCWLGYCVLLALCSVPRPRIALNGLLSGLLTLALLAPWMLDSYRYSATFFYPFLGRGFHGSRYGIYLLPAAQVGLQNVLAFFHGTQNVLFLMLVLQLGLLWRLRPWKAAALRSQVVIAVIVIFSVLMITAGTAAYQIFRYSFSIVFAGVLYLLIEELSIPQELALTRLAGYARPFTLFCTCLLLGGALDGFALTEEDLLSQVQFAVTGKDINSPTEIAQYQAMQLAVPPGQTVMVFLDKHYLLDFRRNLIYINDTPGGASLPPGMPAFRGPDPLADYFLSVGVRYIAYSYADDANFTRAEFGSRLAPHVNVNLRVGAKMAFDFEDNLASLGTTRKRIFDNGKIFVLDLSDKSPQSGTAPTGTSHG